MKSINDATIQSAFQSATAVLRPVGRLDYRSYEGFIAEAKTTYERGARRLAVDLQDVTSVKLSGLFALLSVARLFGGDEMLDPENGWAGLRRMLTETRLDLPKRVTLLWPSPAVIAELKQVGLERLVHIKGVDSPRPVREPSQRTSRTLMACATALWLPIKPT